MHFAIIYLVATCCQICSHISDEFQTQITKLHSESPWQLVRTIGLFNCPSHDKINIRILEKVS